MIQRHFLKTGVLMVLLSCAANPSAFGQTRELGGGGMLLDGVAAIVDEGIVLKSELRQQVTVIAERLRGEGTLPPLPVLERQILEQLVVRRIQLQRAERFGIVVSDDMLNQTLTRMAAQQQVSFEELPARLATEGIDYGLYRQDMREQIVLEQLRQRDVVGRINVSPKEMDHCLTRSENSAADNLDYNTSYILLGAPEAASPQELDQARQQLESIYERLEAGENFAELAVRFSDGQNALDGGALGWRKGSQLPTLFADVVVGLQAGEISQPIQTGSGYYIVQLNETRGAEKILQDQVRVRHILISPNEILDTAAAEQKMVGIRNQIVGGEEFSAIAKAVSEDPISAADGGDLGWAPAGTFAPEFEQTITASAIGTISEPFRTRFGWHILEVLERRQHDTTDEVKEQGCFESIRASKLEEETELWLR
ncbi:MAG: peptidylprolyl isomerase, partial [Gammaproteobacteria bacterium]